MCFAFPLAGDYAGPEFLDLGHTEHSFPSFWLMSFKKHNEPQSMALHLNFRKAWSVFKHEDTLVHILFHHWEAAAFSSPWELLSNQPKVSVEWSYGKCTFVLPIPEMPRSLPLLDLCEEKLDLWESWDMLLELFLLMAVCCSGKWTWMDSTDAARLTDFKEAEESLLPPVRESSSSVSSLLLELSPFSSSSHNPWH